MNKVKVFFGVAIVALAGTIAVQIPALAAKPVQATATTTQSMMGTSTQGSMMGGSGIQDMSKMHQGNGSNGCGNGNMQKMMSNPAMQKMMKDSETAKIMSQGAGMMNNPQMEKLMEKYLPKDLAKQCIKLMRDINKDVKASATAV